MGAISRAIAAGMLCAGATPFLINPRKAAAEESQAVGGVTFSRDVAPVFYARCVGCHRPGQAAPMSLMTYDEVRPWVKSIRQVVAEGRMPPWHADPAFGRFVNDRSLAAEEKDLIERWIAQGARPGDPADMPPIPAFQEGWKLGEPDLVLEFEAVDLPGGGPDQFRDLAAKTAIPEDRWVTAVEVLPGNRKVVHHVIAYAARGGQGSPEAGWLGAWAAGMEPMVFPPGTGRLVRQGERVMANLHYHLAEEPQRDATRVGLHFAEGDVDKEVINLWIANADFLIPPGADNHEVRSVFTFDEESQILSLLPHMHYRGKDFTYTAVWPDGRRQTILRVPRWDFNWQTVYVLAEPLTLPAGSRLECVAHYDNSAANPANPDPTRAVRFGDASYDEMMIGFVDYVVAEGRRPESPIEKMERELAGLAAEAPEAVYRLIAREDDQETYPLGLYFPREGEGRWLIPQRGHVYVGRIYDVRWLGLAFSGKVTVEGFGTFTFKGVTRPAEGTIRGQLFHMDHKFLDFEGALASTTE